MTDKTKIAWCPGCGDYLIRDTLETALKETAISPNKIVLTSGIGQAAKMPQYLNTNYFNGLHGRSLPLACGIKLARPDLTVITVSGDGCMYGEGGNHFIHTIRKNLDITILVCNNKVYGLTKGQCSPTSEKGEIHSLAPAGNHNYPLNPLALAIVAGANFAARGFSGHKEHLKQLLIEAIKFKGTAVVDILQPCASFNKINTHKWYEEHTVALPVPIPDKYEAIKIAEQWEEKIPLGIIYINNQNSEQVSALKFTKNFSSTELQNIIEKNHQKIFD